MSKLVRSGLLAIAALAMMYRPSYGQPPGFNYTVELPDATAYFQEVSGLETPPPSPSVRSAGSVKLPKLSEAASVTLRRGILQGTSLLDWAMQTQSSGARRATVTITLHNAQGGAVRSWTLKNAWPAKLELAPSSGGNDIIVDVVDLVYGRELN